MLCVTFQKSIDKDCFVFFCVEIFSFQIDEKILFLNGVIFYSAWESFHFVRQGVSLWTAPTSLVHVLEESGEILRRELELAVLPGDWLPIQILFPPRCGRHLRALSVHTRWQPGDRLEGPGIQRSWCGRANREDDSPCRSSQDGAGHFAHLKH